MFATVLIPISPKLKICQISLIVKLFVPFYDQNPKQKKTKIIPASIKSFILMHKCCGSIFHCSGLVNIEFPADSKDVRMELITDQTYF